MKTVWGSTPQALRPASLFSGERLSITFTFTFTFAFAFAFAKNPLNSNDVKFSQGRYDDETKIITISEKRYTKRTTKI